MAKETEQITIKEFFEERMVGSVRTMVAIKQMTKDQARQAYPSRPFSKYAESRFGGHEIVDDTCLLLNKNKLAKRCEMCQAPTRLNYLLDGKCPDCDGRSAKHGTDPHQA